MGASTALVAPAEASAARKCHVASWRATGYIDHGTDDGQPTTAQGLAGTRLKITAKGRLTWNFNYSADTTETFTEDRKPGAGTSKYRGTVTMNAKITGRKSGVITER